MSTLLMTMGLFFGFSGIKRCQPKACPSVEKVVVEVDATDQEACEREARLMAKLKSRKHLGFVIGKFEGIGVSRNPKPPTCRPDSRRGLRCTGDATVERDGWFYRVRSFR